MNGPSYAPSMLPVDSDDGISYKAIGGVSGDLLEQNAHMFNQVSSNFSAFQVNAASIFHLSEFFVYLAWFTRN
ncbi:unnamed protein product [Cochlearia groenlandica]